MLRLIAWAFTNLVLGSALLAWLRLRHFRQLLLEQFGLQTAVWGIAELALALFALSSLALRDHARATRLDRMLWLQIGLDIGFIVAGTVLLVVGTQPTRRPRLLGSGVAVTVQGLGLAVLHSIFANQISR